MQPPHPAAPSAQAAIGRPGPHQLAALQAAWERHAAYDPSIRHPVFFTDRLRKPLAVVSALHASPVAHGYAYQGGPRLQRDTGPKL